MMEQGKIRQDMIATCLRMNEAGLNMGSSGNLSVRLPDGFLITPSGIPYEEMSPEQIVEMDWDGRYYGGCVPSSEWRFHFDILRTRADVSVVLHSHSVCCTTLACARIDLPAIHYMIGVSGGSTVKCSGYAPFGSQALSEEALEALGPRFACLLGNHGVITVGKTLKQAFTILAELEHIARIYINAFALGGARLLSEAEMTIVLERFKSYGKQDADASVLGVSPENMVRPPERGGNRLSEREETGRS